MHLKRLGNGFPTSLALVLPRRIGKRWRMRLTDKELLKGGK